MVIFPPFPESTSKQQSTTIQNLRHCFKTLNPVKILTKIRGHPLIIIFKVKSKNCYNTLKMCPSIPQIFLLNHHTKKRCSTSNNLECTTFHSTIIIWR